MKSVSKKRPRPTKRGKSKKVSIKKIISKTIEVVQKPFKKKTSRKPFGGKGRKKKLSEKQQNELEKIHSEFEEPDNGYAAFSEGNGSGPANGFFYTNDGFIQSFEDQEIF